MKICRPYVETLEKNKKSPNYLFGMFKKNMWKFRKDFVNFPDELKRILRKGKVKVDIEDADIRKFTFYLDNAINRLAAGIVMAGLLIAAALIIQARLQPLIFNIPLVSVILVVITLIIGLKLVRSITDEKRRSK